MNDIYSPNNSSIVRSVGINCTLYMFYKPQRNALYMFYKINYF